MVNNNIYHRKYTNIRECDVIFVIWRHTRQRASQMSVRCRKLDYVWLSAILVAEERSLGWRNSQYIGPSGRPNAVLTSPVKGEASQGTRWGKQCKKSTRNGIENIVFFALSPLKSRPANIKLVRRKIFSCPIRSNGSYLW